MPGPECITLFLTAAFSLQWISSQGKADLVYATKTTKTKRFCFKTRGRREKLRLLREIHPGRSSKSSEVTGETQKEEFCLYLKANGDTGNRTRNSLSCMGLKDG